MLKVKVQGHFYCKIRGFTFSFIAKLEVKFSSFSHFVLLHTAAKNCVLKVVTVVSFGTLKAKCSHLMNDCIVN